MTNETICILILILLCIIALLCMLFMIKRDGLKATIIHFITVAEAEYGSGKGEEKMNFVIESVIKLIPAPFNLFITTSTVKNFAEGVFAMVKECLHYQPIDKQEP